MGARSLRGVRALLAAALCVVVAATASGCGTGEFRGLYSLPLPGGAELGEHPYEVVAEFSTVFQLVPHASVKVNHVTVGTVTAIELPEDSWTARVTMLVNGDVRLPANATAHIKKSSLLGASYVALAPPAGGAGRGALAAGATIPLSRTDRSAQVEEVLGALSLLLNGGGIEQLNTITTELNDALSGNEPEIRKLLTRIDELVSSLDANRRDITRAIEGMNQLSATLAERDQQIRNILDNLAPGLRVLERQRGSLVTMLRNLDRLSDVAVRTVNKSTENLVANLEALVPILRRLAEAGQALPQALEVLLTYPFTDQVLKSIRGDYLNVYLSVTAAPGTTVLPPLNTPGSSDGGTAGARRASPPLLPLPAVSGTVSTAPAPSAGSPGSPVPSPGEPPSPSPPAGSGTPSSTYPGTSQSPPGGSPPPSGTQQPGRES